MVLCRAERDVEPLGNFAVREAACHEAEDFAFAIGEGTDIVAMVAVHAETVADFAAFAMCLWQE